jgi:uncharacterized membrane protein YecN with MAPEG domain
MPMPITMLYTGLLGLVLLVLSIRVIQARGATKVFMGDGGNELMLRRMRGQANFVEYVPMALIMMALLELRATAPWVLHLLGATLLIGRLLHGYTFAFAKHFPPGRFGGAVLTQLVVGMAAVLCVLKGFAGL